MIKFLFNKKLNNNNLIPFKKQGSVGGFTLVELMVATSIFVVIMLTAMGSLIAANATSKKAQQLRIAMDNVNFAVEGMTRNLRIGTNYICGYNGDLSVASAPLDCDFSSGPGADSIAFAPSDNMNVTPPSALVEYRIHNNGAWRSLQRLDKTNSTGVDITSSDVDITYLKFFVIGADNTSVTHPNTQPSVYILIRGTVTVQGVASSFSIQTMASQRTSE